MVEASWRRAVRGDIRRPQEVFIAEVGDRSASAFIDSIGYVPHLDGVSDRAIGCAVSEVFGLERVEVFKGHRGTPCRRNSSGGAITLVSRQRRLTDPNGYVSIEGGNNDLVHATVRLLRSIKRSSGLAITGALAEFTPVGRLAGYTTGNVDLTYASLSQRWPLGAYFGNIGNTTAQISAAVSPLTPNYLGVFVPPRAPMARV